MHFGPHLIMDLDACNSKKLNDLSLIFNFLYKLPETIGMQKITQPYVFPYEGLVPEDRGITGFVVIAESHISIHTFPVKSYAFLDVFSCKEFDVNVAKEYAIDLFESKKAEFQVLLRGWGFPREMPIRARRTKRVKIEENMLAIE